jgi:hypothetical protein
MVTKALIVVAVLAALAGAVPSTPHAPPGGRAHPVHGPSR